MLQCVLLLLFAVVHVHTQGSCQIQNTSGKTTDLSGVTAFHWNGPDKAGGTIEYEWEISPCKMTEGICESTDYDGYIQQSAAGGKQCAKNAWFATYTAGSGGQGEDITLSYTGNEIINPPMGRKGEVTISCDSSGQPGQITQCTVDTENNGKDWVYTFTCTGNIACASASPTPVPEPSPGPPPPPSPPGPTPPVGPTPPQPPHLPTAPVAPAPTPEGKPEPGGWIFVGIVLGAIFIYIVGGLVFGIAVRKQPVSEAFPNIEFWKDFPGLVKDGVVFSISPCRRG